MAKVHSAVVVVLLGWAGVVTAEEQGWETVLPGPPVMVKTRALEGTSIKEVWAQGELAAAVQDVQSVLTDPESHAKFMPHVKESRTIGKPDPDGSVYTYQRLELPWLSSRDYVSKVTNDQLVNPDGTGEFRQRWVALPDRIPSRAHVIRLRHNQGSWHVKPIDGQRSFAVYRFSVDPGGWIPGFAKDMGTKQGVSDTFKAVETEAKRRSTLRKTQAEAAKPSSASAAGK